MEMASNYCVSFQCKSRNFWLEYPLDGGGGFHELEIFCKKSGRECETNCKDFVDLNINVKSLQESCQESSRITHLFSDINEPKEAQLKYYTETLDSYCLEGMIKTKQTHGGEFARKKIRFICARTKKRCNRLCALGFRVLSYKLR